MNMRSSLYMGNQNEFYCYAMAHLKSSIWLSRIAVLLMSSWSRVNADGFNHVRASQALTADEA